ncbi:UNVERIFIED_CONTAM: hypothetical protein K2H54_051376 [Gekko kuhli]
MASKLWWLLNMQQMLQAFFCGRSDYFKALLEDHFSESEELQTQPSIPVVTLHNISEEIFIQVLYYIYSDDTEDKTVNDRLSIGQILAEELQAEDLHRGLGGKSSSNPKQSSPESSEEDMTVASTSGQNGYIKNSIGKD